MKKIVTLSLTALLALGMFGCMPPQNAGQSDAPSSQAPTEENAAENEGAEEAPEGVTEEEAQRQQEELREQAAAAGVVTLNAGDTATSDTGLTFALSEGTWEAQVPGAQAEEGEEFYVVEGTIENTTSAPINLTEHVVATLTLGEGGATGTVLLPDSTGDAVLQPGQTATLTIAAPLSAELKSSTETPVLSLEIRATDDAGTVANVYQVTLA